MSEQVHDVFVSYAPDISQSGRESVRDAYENPTREAFFKLLEHLPSSPVLALASLLGEFEKEGAVIGATLGDRSTPMEEPDSSTVGVALPTPQDTRVAKLMALERENAQLRLQVENLKSRVSEERRVAARESQRYDQLKGSFDSLMDRYSERTKACDGFLAGVTARQDQRLKMFESYEGEVIHVHGDEVVVVYRVDGDIVEHTYVRSQFIDGQLAKRGERLAVYSHVALLPAEPLTSGKTTDTDQADEQTRRRRNTVRLPLEF